MTFGHNFFFRMTQYFVCEKLHVSYYKVLTFYRLKVVYFVLLPGVLSSVLYALPLILLLPLNLDIQPHYGANADKYIFQAIP